MAILPRNLTAMRLEIHGSTSLFNDGKGIKVTVSFLPLPPPLKTGEKRRKNAKPKLVKGILYVHEDQSLSQFLDAVIDNIDETRNLTFSIANRSGLLDTDCFTLEYSVNRSDSKDIAIRNAVDYKTLIEEILTLNRPASSFKVQITEKKVSSPVLPKICILKACLVV